MTASRLHEATTSGALGLEGIVSKQANSRYRSGPATAWLKCKCVAEGEFLIIGTERGHGPTTLLLATEQAGALAHAGSAILALTEPERDQFWMAADALQVDRPLTTSIAGWAREDREVGQIFDYNRRDSHRIRPKFLRRAA